MASNGCSPGWSSGSNCSLSTSDDASSRASSPPSVPEIPAVQSVAPKPDVSEVMSAVGLGDPKFQRMLSGKWNMQDHIPVVVKEIKTAVRDGINAYEGLAGSLGLSLEEAVVLHIYTWESINYGSNYPASFYAPLNELHRLVKQAPNRQRHFDWCWRHKPKFQHKIQLEMWETFQGILTRARAKLEEADRLRVVYRMLSTENDEPIFHDKRVGDVIRLIGNVSTTDQKVHSAKSEKWDTILRWVVQGGSPISKISRLPYQSEVLFENIDLQVRFKVRDPDTKTLTVYCGLPNERPKTPTAELDTKLKSVLSKMNGRAAASNLLRMYNRHERTRRGSKGKDTASRAFARLKEKYSVSARLIRPAGVTDPTMLS